MADYDTTDLRVEAILHDAFVEAYGLDREEPEDEPDTDETEDR